MSNERISKGKLAGLVASRALLGIPALCLFFFVPAGTLDYWQAWVWLGIVLIPMLFIFIYLLRNDPALLERRMRMREQQTQQKRVIAASWIYYLVVFLLPGFDRRFGWSDVPVALVIAADVLVFAGYALFFLVLRANSYASRVVEVTAGQRVISNGPYALVRHPMYLGVMTMYVFSPLALGSYVAFLPALLIIPILVARIRNEEQVLAQELPGYTDYMQRTRFRVVPGVW